jgi:SPP1 gp7 family putative phage head morphogenesis protein
MPVQLITHKGAPAARWGQRGAVYTYGPGTPRTKAEAVALAARQGRAVRAAQADAWRWMFTRTGSVRTPRMDAKRPKVRGAYKGDMPSVSTRIEQEFEAFLRSRVDIIQRLVKQYAGKAIREIQREIDAERQDSAALDLYMVLRVIRDAVEGMDNRQGLLFIGQAIDEDATESADLLLSRVFNIPITSVVQATVLDGWIRDNVALITSIQATALDQVEALVRDAMTGGRPTMDLMADIERRFDVSRSRASLIARDQTAKLASAVGRERQQAVGVTRYQWSTSGDPRVRQEHADLDGKIFEWSDPPEVGGGRRAHPGQDFQCRCVSIPILDESQEAVAEMVAEAEARKETELMLMQQSPTVHGEIENLSGFSDWNAARIAEIRAGVRSSVGL